MVAGALGVDHERPGGPCQTITIFHPGRAAAKQLLLAAAPFYGKRFADGNRIVCNGFELKNWWVG